MSTSGSRKSKATTLICPRFSLPHTSSKHSCSTLKDALDSAFLPHSKSLHQTSRPVHALYIVLHDLDTSSLSLL
eukprot:m.47178 g.47178  ORF g.47178 m.47178 type:complete len:74 (-) comp6343_c0_seq1:2447-2668(-)